MSEKTRIVREIRGYALIAKDGDLQVRLSEREMRELASSVLSHLLMSKASLREDVREWLEQGGDE
jgi:hypothetical protein